MPIPIKTPEEIKIMRRAGQILADVLYETKKLVVTGITTIELDTFAENLIKTLGAQSAFRGYRGFPNTLCTCINDEVVHAIPNKRRLNDGDIISIDCGVIYNGFYSDSAITVTVGTVKKEILDFIETTEKALYAGISQAKSGNHIGDISNAIQTTIEGKGYSVVYDLVGHGIGKNLHEEPQIPNFGAKGKGPQILPGMTFAIEVMANMGQGAVKTLKDNWTIVTRDGSLSAQTEHTVLITETGREILTQKRA